MVLFDTNIPSRYIAAVGHIYVLAGRSGSLATITTRTDFEIAFERPIDSDALESMLFLSSIASSHSRATFLHMTQATPLSGIYIGTMGNNEVRGFFKKGLDKYFQDKATS